MRLDEYLPLIVGGAIVLLIALVFSWAAFGAPRRAARLFRRLEAQGYGPARPDDLQLKQALDRLTPIMFHTYALSTVTETSPWRVKLACARYEGWTSRYVAMINRSVSRTTPQSTTLEHHGGPARAGEVGRERDDLIRRGSLSDQFKKIRARPQVGSFPQPPGLERDSVHGSRTASFYNTRRLP